MASQSFCLDLIDCPPSPAEQRSDGFKNSSHQRHLAWRQSPDLSSVFSWPAILSGSDGGVAEKDSVAVLLEHSPPSLLLSSWKYSLDNRWARELDFGRAWISLDMTSSFSSPVKPQHTSTKQLQKSVFFGNNTSPMHVWIISVDGLTCRKQYWSDGVADRRSTW